jgi:hypothetical protein
MLPNFIIIGAEKTGSTSLYHYLSQHPDVFMCSPKEPNFFSENGPIHTLDEYESLFVNATTESAIGEASVGYLQSPGAGVRIKELLPSVRLIAILRDPAERAYSHYNMLLEHSAVPHRSFLEALHAAERENDFAYTGVPTSRYADALQHYLDLFGDQLQVYIFNEFKHNPRDTVQSIFDHIGVNPRFTPNLKRSYNKTHRPKSGWLNQLIWKKSKIKTALKKVFSQTLRAQLRRLILKSNRSPVPPLSPEARRIVIDLLKDDIRKTEDLIGRELPQWKK